MFCWIKTLFTMSKLNMLWAVFMSLGVEGLEYCNQPPGNYIDVNQYNYISI